LWEPKKSVTAATIEADDNLNEDKTDGYYPL
jgi:hypothetical protein